MDASIKRVTMADVAASEGVSTSTVSRALRGDPRIRLEVRASILRRVEAMGYTPSPMISALMSGRRSKDRHQSVETIGLITDYGGSNHWKSKDVCRWEYEGIIERAGQLGFHIEEFALADYGRDYAKLGRVLMHRGIYGVLFGFSRNSRRENPFPFQHFAVAGLSAYFRDIPIDRSNFHGLHNVCLAMDHLHRLGYRRTGLVVPEFNNRISGYQWSGGVLDWQRRQHSKCCCPPFIPSEDDCEPAFADWIKQHRPDSLLVYKLPVEKWLTRLSVNVPRDMGLAYLYRTEQEIRNAAGIDGNLSMVGAAAVDLVVERINAHRSGLPPHPKEVLIKGKWVDGPTLRNAPEKSAPTTRQIGSPTAKPAHSAAR